MYFVEFKITIGKPPYTAAHNKLLLQPCESSFQVRNAV